MVFFEGAWRWPKEMSTFTLAATASLAFGNREGMREGKKMFDLLHPFQLTSKLMQDRTCDLNCILFATFQLLTLKHQKPKDCLTQVSPLGFRVVGSVQVQELTENACQALSVSCTLPWGKCRSVPRSCSSSKTPKGWRPSVWHPVCHFEAPKTKRLFDVWLRSLPSSCSCSKASTQGRHERDERPAVWLLSGCSLWRMSDQFPRTASIDRFAIRGRCSCTASHWSTSDQQLQCWENFIKSLTRRHTCMSAKKTPNFNCQGWDTFVIQPCQLKSNTSAKIQVAIQSPEPGRSQGPLLDFHHQDSGCLSDIRLAPTLREKP